jgi:hypothetical protein
MIYPVFEYGLKDIQRMCFSTMIPSDTGSFIMGIQTQWKLQQMIHFGKNSLVAADTTFGINKLKYPLYTLLILIQTTILSLRCQLLHEVLQVMMFIRDHCRFPYFSP